MLSAAKRSFSLCSKHQSNSPLTFKSWLDLFRVATWPAKIFVRGSQIPVTICVSEISCPHGPVVHQYLPVPQINTITIPIHPQQQFHPSTTRASFASSLQLRIWNFQSECERYGSTLSGGTEDLSESFPRLTSFKGSEVAMWVSGNRSRTPGPGWASDRQELNTTDMPKPCVRVIFNTSPCMKWYQTITELLIGELAPLCRWHLFEGQENNGWQKEK